MYPKPRSRATEFCPGVAADGEIGASASGGGRGTGRILAGDPGIRSTWVYRLMRSRLFSTTSAAWRRRTHWKMASR